MIYTYVASPLGDLLVVRHDRLETAGPPGGLTGLYLPKSRHATAIRVDWHRDGRAFDDVGQELDEYFAGNRRQFTLTLDPVGTGFQKKVWAALADIPYGETTSYGAVAATIGTPTGSRAVGLANGQNPLSIIVPCHRVVGANGAMTGYGGGLAAKRWLLTHERAHAGLFV